MRNCRYWMGICALLTLVGAAPLRAQTAAERQLDEQLRGVEVIQKIGDKLPLDVPFVDDNGRTVTLARYFKPGVPVLLTLNYSDCARNCSLQLTDLARALREMEWRPGREFTIVTISIDPKEDYKRARQSKIRYLGESTSGREVDAGWHFLTSSDEANARRVAEAVGYHYRFDAETGQYLHKNAMFLVTGQGVISHYVSSLGYEASFLQGYLQASAEGRLGSPVSDDGTGFGLNCFAMEYTDNIGRAYLMMRIGGGAVFAFLVCFVGYFWLRELKRARAARSPNKSLNVETA